MQPDLFALLDAEPQPQEQPEPPPQFQPATTPIPEADPQFRVSDCRVCGGSGACSARSNRAKIIPCVCCCGFGKAMHDSLGRRVTFRTMAVLLKEMGIAIPAHAYTRY